jgi:phosphoribosyl 1,2-cyclic phosphate phosphodiesterase
MSLKFILLGSGSSMGVPRADGDFGNCDPKNKKNYRTRCSALIKFNKENILIDTSPDLRQQLIFNNIKSINKVFYTHLHADQTHGINDLRAFFLKNKKQLPVYADKKTAKYLLSTFKYCFKSTTTYPSTLTLNTLKKKIVLNCDNENLIIKAIPVKHGNIESVCYLLNNELAYASDISLIYKKDINLFKNLRYFIIDCLWLKKHPAHFNLEQVLDIVKIIKPKKTILTNMHSDLDYNSLKKILPKNIIPGFDGMTITL